VSTRRTGEAPAGLSIALIHPTYWPEVRRGGERLVHDLGEALASRGHDVTLLTTHRARSSSSVEDGIRVVRSWRPPTFPPFTWYEDHVVTMPAAAWRLLRGSFDVAHAFFPSSAWAAVRARRLGGPPVVSSLHGIPMREHLVARRYRIEMMRGAMAGAEVSSVLSEAAAAAARRYLLVDPIVLPGGVVLERFATDVAKASAPTLLCTASIGDPRKRGDLLVRAFERVRAKRPDAELLVARTPDPFMSPEVHELPDGARWVDAEDTAALARLYGSAWATVLPSVWEPFGLVLIESLAAGTPVVAARSGACPEIVDREQIGTLFEPDDEASLAAAMLESLELAASDGVADACRERAADYDWNRVVLDYEAAYAAALGSR
jgi:glycosyltransferase involved in cell wall biosynthesis